MEGGNKVVEQVKGAVGEEFLSRGGGAEFFQVPSRSGSSARGPWAVS